MQEDVTHAVIVVRHQVIGFALENNPVAEGIGGGVAAGAIAGRAGRRTAEQGETLVEQVKPIDVAGPVTVGGVDTLGRLKQQPLTLRVEQGLRHGLAVDAAGGKPLLDPWGQGVHAGEGQWRGSRRRCNRRPGCGRGGGWGGRGRSAGRGAARDCPGLGAEDGAGGDTQTRPIAVERGTEGNVRSGLHHHAALRGDAGLGGPRVCAGAEGGSVDGQGVRQTGSSDNDVQVPSTCVVIVIAGLVCTHIADPGGEAGKGAAVGTTASADTGGHTVENDRVVGAAASGGQDASTADHDVRTGGDRNDLIRFADAEDLDCRWGRIVVVVADLIGDDGAGAGGQTRDGAAVGAAAGTDVGALAGEGNRVAGVASGGGHDAGAVDHDDRGGTKGIAP